MAAAIGSVVTGVSGVLSLADGAGKMVEDVQKLTLLGKSGRFSLTSGEVKEGDVLLYREKLRKTHVAFGKARHIYRYKCQPNEMITCVVAIDEWGDGTGGSPEIIKGGVNCNFVEVEVTSQVWRGFDFTVSVFGSKK